MWNTSKKILLFLIFSLSWNLGKHFEYEGSYVKGLLVDYHVPTIFVQDILVLLLLITFLIESLLFSARRPSALARGCDLPSKAEKKLRLSLDWRTSLLRKGRGFLFKNLPFLNNSTNIAVRFYFLFCFGIFLSTFFSSNSVSSIYFFCRVFLYFSFFVISSLFLQDLRFRWQALKALLLGTFLIAVLGIAQFVKQGSIFNNYLYFGEQPYSKSTSSIVVKNYFGLAIVPAYGLFRHPNTFAGFLSLVILFFLDSIFLIKNYRTKFVLLLGATTCFISVLTTLSILSIGVCIFGIVFYFLYRYLSVNFANFLRTRKFRLFSLTLFFTPLLAGVLIFLIPVVELQTNPSYFRRASLSNSSLTMIKHNTLFGVGANNFTVLLEDVAIRKELLRFVQPVHNIFLLSWSESGFFTCITFIFLLFIAYHKSVKNLSFFAVPIVVILSLGSFDHYFYTQHQTFLLLLLTLALALSYTRASDTAKISKNRLQV